MSTPNTGGSGSRPPPKAIGSLAKKPSDVTRQGTQKLKFVPTLPQRRNKEEVKAEPVAASIPPASSSQRGRGRGRGFDGDGRSRGRGRGAPPSLVMTASGPFAMGPVLGSNSSHKAALPRSNAGPRVTLPSSERGVGPQLSGAAAPSLKSESKVSKGKEREEEDEEVYSEQEGGIEVIDIQDVRKMDWMAPEPLPREKQTKKIKKEAKNDVNAANALDLSASEEEEEMEDVIENFTSHVHADTDTTLREDKLYLFQFPDPFPVFMPKQPMSDDDAMAPVDTEKDRVTLSQDVKLESPPQIAKVEETEKTKAIGLDGIIGQLELYRSGAVKIRLQNGILLEVNGATQPSFLQQAVHLNKTKNRLDVIGEVNKQFIVSPDIETLLRDLEISDTTARELPLEGGEKLIKMDL